MADVKETKKYLDLVGLQKYDTKNKEYVKEQVDAVALEVADVRTALDNETKARTEADTNLGQSVAAAKKAADDAKAKLGTIPEDKTVAEVIQAEADRATGAENNLGQGITAINSKIGTVAEGTTVVKMIEDAKTAATYDDTDVKASIKANTDAIEAHKTAIDAKVTTLVGDDADKSVRTIANEELTKQLVPDGAKESLDTLQEIAAWIQKHPDDASAMNAAIEKLNAIVAGIGGADEKATVVAYVQDAIASAVANMDTYESISNDEIDALFVKAE